MIEKMLKHALRCYGPDTAVAYVRWTPSGSATQTVTESAGVASVTRSNAGVYSINFSEKPKAIIPVSAEVVENDTTHYHVARVESTSVGASPAAAVTHKSVAFASVASGPAGSDTVDELCFVFLLRMTA